RKHHAHSACQAGQLLFILSGRPRIHFSLQCSENVFKPLLALFRVPQAPAKCAVNVIASEQIFEGFICKPATPIVTEASACEKNVRHVDSYVSLEGTCSPPNRK